MEDVQTDEGKKRAKRGEAEGDDAPEFDVREVLKDVTNIASALSNSFSTQPWMGDDLKQRLEGAFISIIDEIVDPEDGELNELDGDDVDDLKDRVRVLRLICDKPESK